MRLRTWVILAGLLSSISFSIAQSIDEEEAAPHIEGSANIPSDDEDFEGSALPPDQQYATSPVIRTVTTTIGLVRDTTPVTTPPRQSTTIYKQEASSFGTSTPRHTTRAQYEPEATGPTFFSSSAIYIGLGALIIALLIIVVVLVFCCKKSNGYTPGKRDPNDA